MNGKPSFLTSTTAAAYLIVVTGAVVFAFVTKNTDLILRLVEMLVPAYASVKGYQMATKGQNGEIPKPGLEASK